MIKKNLILVFNCGSSSIKFAIINPKTGEQAITGLVENIHAQDTCMHLTHGKEKTHTPLPGARYKEAMHEVIKQLEQRHELIHCLLGVGHRVVHGGESFTTSTLIDTAVINEIKACSDLAPLHNPANASGIDIARELFPHLPHVAVFDTAFHQSLPEHAYLYALPLALYEKHKVRRYGFHGTSHKFVTQTSADMLGKSLDSLKLISAHLGNGCSVAAVLQGKSVDTSMGFTPLEGLVMGTRSGDLDPALIDYLIQHANMTSAEVTHLLNKESGLLGISGISMDMRTITQAANKGEKRAMLAIDIACYRLAKYIASYFIPLGGCDALIFTGGIGEHAKNIREKTLHWLAPLGFKVDNLANENDGKETLGIITTPTSKIAMVTPTNEEWLIAQDTWQISKGAV